MCSVWHCFVLDFGMLCCLFFVFVVLCLVCCHCWSRFLVFGWFVVLACLAVCGLGSVFACLFDCVCGLRYCGVLCLFVFFRVCCSCFDFVVMFVFWWGVFPVLL